MCVDGYMCLCLWSYVCLLCDKPVSLDVFVPVLLSFEGVYLGEVFIELVFCVV